MSNRRSRIRFPVFRGFEVRVILSRDLVATGRRLKEEDDLSHADAALVVSKKDPMTCWLLLGPDGRDADTISHEASHAVKQLFKSTGVKMDEEAFAYHLGYLVGKVHNFINQGKS